jgi:hypothetical protein
MKKLLVLWFLSFLGINGYFLCCGSYEQEKIWLIYNYSFSVINIFGLLLIMVSKMPER